MNGFFNFGNLAGKKLISRNGVSSVQVCLFIQYLIHARYITCTCVFTTLTLILCIHGQENLSPSLNVFEHVLTSNPKFWISPCFHIGVTMAMFPPNRRVLVLRFPRAQHAVPNDRGEELRGPTPLAPRGAKLLQGAVATAT